MRNWTRYHHHRRRHHHRRQSRTAGAGRRGARCRRRPARLPLPAPPRCKGYTAVSDMLERDPRLNTSAIKMGLWLVRTARGRASIEAFVEQIGGAINRRRRMVQYAQKLLDECGYIKVENVRLTKEEGGYGCLNEANIYHLLAPLLAPNPRRRRPSRREAVGVQNNAHPVSPSEKSLPPEPFAAREEREKGAAGRGEPAVPVRETALPPPVSSPSGPQEARQVASATKTDASRGEPRPRAPP
jgi:hypothetical protein